MKQLLWMTGAMGALAVACGGNGDGDGADEGNDKSSGPDAGSGQTVEPFDGDSADINFDPHDSHGGDDHTLDVDVSEAPPLEPRLLMHTLVGGEGNQAIRNVGFEQDGSILALGKDFTVRVDADGQEAAVEGDISTPDDDKFRGNNKLQTIGRTIDDPRNGATYEIGMNQVGGNLQQPFLETTLGWSFWGWDEKEAGDLRADSRGYDVWLMPNGLIGVNAWTDGGNTTLVRDPRDLDEPLGVTDDGVQSSAGGVATLWLLIDPAEAEPLSGTFLYTQSLNRAHDRWGRTFITDRISKNTTPNNPFGMPEEARAGLFGLDSALQKEILNIRLGSECEKPLKSQLAAIAVRDNILVAGGTSCDAPFVATDNAIQEDPGGDQDGFLVVLELWPE